MICKGNTSFSHLLFFNSSAANFQMVGRVVFGEARGESTEGQIAVAYTIVNRISHAGYPSNLDAVVHQKTRGGLYQYNTLSDQNHNDAWDAAKAGNTFEYKSAIQNAEKVLCCRETDPTTCATDFCSNDPCRSTNSSPTWEATNKMQIGNLYFVCRVRK